MKLYECDAYSCHESNIFICRNITKFSVGPHYEFIIYDFIFMCNYSNIIVIIIKCSKCNVTGGEVNQREATDFRCWLSTSNSRRQQPRHSFDTKLKYSNCFSENPINTTTSSDSVSFYATEPTQDRRCWLPENGIEQQEDEDGEAQRFDDGNVAFDADYGVCHVTGKLEQRRAANVRERRRMRTMNFAFEGMMHILKIVHS